MGFDPGGGVSWVGTLVSGVFVLFGDGVSVPDSGSDPLGQCPDSKLGRLHGR